MEAISPPNEPAKRTKAEENILERISEHANMLQQGGWHQEATNLHKWVRELRDSAVSTAAAISVG